MTQYLIYNETIQMFKYHLLKQSNNTLPRQRTRTRAVAKQTVVSPQEVLLPDS